MTLACAATLLLLSVQCDMCVCARVCVNVDVSSVKRDSAAGAIDISPVAFNWMNELVRCCCCCPNYAHLALIWRGLLLRVSLFVGLSHCHLFERFFHDCSIHLFDAFSRTYSIICTVHNCTFKNYWIGTFFLRLNTSELSEFVWYLLNFSNKV